jgi:hypothetical protein
VFLAVVLVARFIARVRTLLMLEFIPVIAITTNRSAVLLTVMFIACFIAMVRTLLMHEFILVVSLGGLEPCGTLATITYHFNDGRIKNNTETLATQSIRWLR